MTRTRRKLALCQKNHTACDTFRFPGSCFCNPMSQSSLAARCILLLLTSSLGACQVASLVGLKKPGDSPSKPQATPTEPATAPQESAAPSANKPVDNNRRPAKSNRTDGRIFATPEQYDGYHALLKGHEPALKILYHLHEGRTHLPKDPGPAAKRIRGLVPAMAAVQQFAPKCEAYRDLVIMSLQPWTEPRVACDTAKSANKAPSKLATLAAKDYVKRQAKVVLGTIEGLGTGYTGTELQLQNLLTADPAAEQVRVAKAVAPLLALADSSLTLDNEIPNIGEMRKDALAKGLEASKKHLFTQKASARIGKTAKNIVAKRKSGLKVRKLLSKNKDWKIHKASTGIPSHRSHAAQVIGKAKGESFCRLYDVSLVQSYTGAGTWQKSIRATIENGFRILNCN